MLPIPLQRFRAYGTSLVDVMFAISLVSFASASLFLLYSNALQLLRTQGDIEAATLCLQDRAEQVRSLNWDQLDSAASLKSMLSTLPASTKSLSTLTEDITVTPYPATASTPLHLRRTAPASPVSVTTISQPSDTSLANATVVQVVLRATWTGSGRTHIRENTLLVAPGGRPS